MRGENYLCDNILITTPIIVSSGNICARKFGDNNEHMIMLDRMYLVTTERAQ